MGAFPRGHAGGWDLPWVELGDEFAPAQLDADPFAQPFADANPAPPEPSREFCPQCRWGLEPDGSCWRCAGCPRCRVRLDADMNCCMCGGTFFPPAVRREERRAA